MTYEILDHPADVKFRAIGDTLSAAFLEVVEAVSELVGGEPDTDQPAVTRELVLDAQSLEALLFDFLDQLILFQDIEDAVVTTATDLEIDEAENGYRLSAVIHARPIPADQPLLDIKAPTYSQMLVKENGGWTIGAVLDV